MCYKRQIFVDDVADLVLAAGSELVEDDAVVADADLGDFANYVFVDYDDDSGDVEVESHFHVVSSYLVEDPIESIHAKRLWLVYFVACLRQIYLSYLLMLLANSSS